MQLKTYVYIFFFFKKYFIYLFLERGKGREKERERNIDRLPLAHPQRGTGPITQGCALTGNRSTDLSLCRMTPNQLSHTSQGYVCIYIFLKNPYRISSLLNTVFFILHFSLENISWRSFLNIHNVLSNFSIYILFHCLNEPLFTNFLLFSVICNYRQCSMR